MTFSNVFVAVVVASAMACSQMNAATNTWDADVVAPGAQDGPGIWVNGAANWWDGTANVPWDSAAPESAVFGVSNGVAGTVTLGGPITVSNLYFHAVESGSYVIEGNGHELTFGVAATSGIGDPIFWVSEGVTVTNRANSQDGTRLLDVTGGGTLVLEGTNIFRAIDVADADISRPDYGGILGVPGTTVIIPAGASLRTQGTTPLGLSAGMRLRDGATLIIDGTLITSSGIGGYSGEDKYTVAVNPGAVVTNSGELVLGWNSMGTLNMNGGLCVVYGNIHHMDGNDSYVNLNGGVLEASRVYNQTGNGTFRVNFNGGILRARNNDLLAEVADKSRLTEFRVQNGGAVIDSNGNSVETAQTFTREGSGGLTKLGTGTLTFTGGTYTGDTTVAAGTLNLSFNKRASMMAGGTVGDFHLRSDRLILNGGNLAVTGRAAFPEVVKNTIIGDSLKRICGRLLGANTGDLVAGMTVTGDGIAPDTYVTHIKDSSKVLLSRDVPSETIFTNMLTFGAVSDTTWQTIQNVELRQDTVVTVNNNGGPGTTLTLRDVTGAGGLTKAGDGTLMLSPGAAYGGATTVEAGTLRLTRGVADVIANASFETHNAFPENRPNWNYDPGGTIWTFSGAGIAMPGSPWVGSGTLIDGEHVGFVQNGGRIEGNFTAPASGQCVISFLAGSRPSYTASELTLQVDGATVLNLSPQALANTQGNAYTVSTFVEAGAHTLTFKGTEVSGSDRGTWYDRIEVTFLDHGGLLDILPAGSDVTVAAGAVLDLGGNAQTLARLAGGGLVTNGTLAVNGIIAPGTANAPGTLTIPSGAALSGTLLVDVWADGTCDALAASGALDVSGLALQIQDTALLNTQARYLIARCAPGGLTGRFSTNLAGLWRVAYDSGAGEVWVELTRGTQLILR